MPAWGVAQEFKLTRKQALKARFNTADLAVHCNEPRLQRWRLGCT